MVSLLSEACSTVAPELMATKTPTPTVTAVPPTETPTIKPTATNTRTPTSPPSKGQIRIEPPADPNVFLYEGGLPSISLAVLTEEQLDRLIENTLASVPFSTCPKIWMEAVPDSQYPTFALFIDTSPDDHDKGFAVMIRSTVPEGGADGTIGMGIMSQESAGKSLVAASYQPAEGKSNPAELEIQLVFPGCEIFTGTIQWPA